MSYKTLDCSEISFDAMQIFAGSNDRNIRTIEKEFDTKLVVRAHEIKLEEGSSVSQVEEVIAKCFERISHAGKLGQGDVAYLCMLAQKGKLKDFSVIRSEPVAKTKSGKLIYPKTIGQTILCDAMKNNEIVFSTGVAGTGKTYLAVAYAVSMLKHEKVEKIILTRPAVEAGESLGFLPGDMKEKVDPYLRPLYDALNEMLGTEIVEKYIEKEIIEIAPLAFMRGRTLNNAVVILDEAQNTTKAQMKMFLTRMGRQTKMIVTGDITQIDLIRKKDSGLTQACEILEGIEGIEIVHLHDSDVVRNPLVQKIIERYAKVE